MVPWTKRAKCAASVAGAMEGLARGRVFVPSSVMQSESERSENRPSALSFAGVSLLQLAAVAAARAEGFSLEEILVAEGLEATTYRAADIAYKSGLVDATKREELAADYQKELTAAEDRLARKVSPIDEDVDAWVRFLGTYGAQSAPADWLVTLGLNLPDLSRLSRSWKRRLESDDHLRKRAEKSARDKKPYDISSLRVSPVKLVPSPVAKPLDPAKAEDSASFSVSSPAPVKKWKPRVEPAEEAPAIDPGPQNLGVAFVFPINVAAASPLAMTTPGFSLPKDEVLPFIDAPEIPEEPLTPEEQAAIAAPPREALSGTSLSLDIPRGPATPFAGDKAPKNVPEKPKSTELPKVKPAPAELAGTSLVVNIPRGPATPFVSADKPVVVDDKPAETKLPQVKPAPAALGGTSLSVDIPRGPALPFAGAKAKETPVEVTPKAVVAQPRVPEVPRKNEEKAPARPLLSLEQHAALTVEIATYPAHALAILKRYGLTPPQKVDLDQYYQRIVASDPAKQAAWHAAYGAHYAALVRMPRR